MQFLHANLSTASLIAILAAAGPIFLLTAILVPSRLANRSGRNFARLMANAALLTFVSAIASAVMLAVREESQRGLVYIDPLSVTMYLLVSFLVLIVANYSINYLAGHPRQGHFSKWLAVTSGCVLTLTLSGNLLLFTLAWMATSLSLHKLLIFCKERPGAAVAAKKKFIISRIGDACMLGVLAITWHCFGTWSFKELFSQAEAIQTGGSPSSCVSWVCILLVSGALLKSAQFPFHSWLPDTMETPTPVSALMHAGIINAGGFLVVRLSPLVACSPAALNTLAIVGAFTALFASVVMLTQTNIKRFLAYSTIAQMGFMMMQCGLGAFALAILHIAAHSLYKAHAFLTAGSVVQISKAAWVPTQRPISHLYIFAMTCVVGAAGTWATGYIFGITPKSGASTLLLGVIFTLGATFLLWNLWSSHPRTKLIAWGLGLAIAVSIAYFSLHAVFEYFLASSLTHYEPERGVWEYAVMILVALSFLAVLALQSQLSAWSTSHIGRRLYVHASRGFYLGAFANRLTNSFTSKNLFTYGNN